MPICLPAITPILVLRCAPILAYTDWFLKSIFRLGRCLMNTEPNARRRGFAEAPVVGRSWCHLFLPALLKALAMRRALSACLSPTRRQKAHVTPD
jgi:hypothetical protein